MTNAYRNVTIGANFSTPFQSIFTRSNQVVIGCFDMKGNDCRNIFSPAVEMPDECLVDVAYTYSITNSGSTGQRIDSLMVTRGNSAAAPSGTRDLTALLTSNLLGPGVRTAVSETDTVNICLGLSFETTADAASTTDGMVRKPCADSNRYTFEPRVPCNTRVDIACVNANGGDCAQTPQPLDPGGCQNPYTYTYTVQNIGATCMELDSWRYSMFSVGPDGSSNGKTVDLLPQVPNSDRNICPGETFSLANTVVTDLCAGITYKTTTDVSASPPEGSSCQATDEYEVMPVTSQGCAPLVDITCVDSSGADCALTGRPQNIQQCEEQFTFTFKVSNVGTTCIDVQTLSRDFGIRGGINLPTRDLLPLPIGETICPNDGSPSSSVSETIGINLCEGNMYDVAVAFTGQSPGAEECQAGDLYSVQPAADCLTETAIACVNSGGNECGSTPVPLDAGECEELVTYTYSIEAIGVTCMTLSDFRRGYIITDANGNEIQVIDDDIIGLIPPIEREMCPGDAAATIVETIPTNLCQGNSYNARTLAVANPPNGDSCQDISSYIFSPTAGCLVEVGVSCFNSQGNDCRTTPPPLLNSSDCLETFQYCYSVANIGSTCMDITELVSVRNGEARDLAPLFPSELCPNDVNNPATVCTDPEPTNICNGQAYATTMNAQADPPNGGVCQAIDQYIVAIDSPVTLSPTPSPTRQPTLPDNCEVDIFTECSTQADTINSDGDCNGILPIITRCDERATFMEMLFNGGNCDQSFNIQGSDKFDCTDAGGGPAEQGMYWIHVAPAKDLAGTTYFSGPVEAGNVFPMCPGYPECTGERFEADTTIFIFPEDPGNNPTTKGTWAQLINFHSSCSQNLFLKDKYGSTQLVIFFNGSQGLVSCFITASFAITLTNEGLSNADRLVSFTNTINGNTTDLTDSVLAVESGQTVVVTTQILIDMTVRQSYEVTTMIIGATSRGQECSDSFTFNFAAGNDLEAPPGVLAPESF